MTDGVNNEPMTKPIINMIFITAIIIIVIGTAFHIVSARPFATIPFALGVAVTSALNIVKLKMLDRTVLKVVNMDNQEAGKNTIRVQHLLRFLLTGIVLVAVGFIQNYTTAPPFFSNREFYLPIWALLFPNGPESLLEAPFISLWGALAGLFTMQLSVVMARHKNVEMDKSKIIDYSDEDADEDPTNEVENDTNPDSSRED